MDLRDELQASLGSRYTLKHELSGGMSRVFVATEQALFRDVVIKVLPQELAAHVSLERFKREILLAARLQHAHIVPLLAAGEAYGHPYYTMPYIAGESLRERMRHPDRLPLAEATRILREIASALAYAHDHGVVHRDVKPDNVLLSSGSAMVSDFGVAKALFESSNAELSGVTAAGMALGTPAYMAPEQISGAGDVDHRADIYSFGVLAYEMLAGTAPITGRTPHDVMAAHMTKTPDAIATHVPQIPDALAALIMSCLAKDPAARPQSVADVVRVIDALVTTTGGTGRTMAASGDWRRPARLAVVVGGVVVAVVALGLALSGRFRSDTESADGSLARMRTLVVLPLANVGGDTASEYFADGMTDAVSNELAQLPGVRVAARSSAYRYKDQGVSVADVGRALGVGSVVLGSVQRITDRVRITAQLVSVSDGLARWSKTFERPFTDVFAVQEAIAVEIAGALNVTLAGAAAQLRGVGTKNVEAYDLYLRAMAIERKYTETDIRRSIPIFQQAIALDPAYAAPWAGIAKAWINLADDWLPPREAYPRAREAAMRALALDTMSVDAHAMLGTIAHDYEWDIPAAADHLQHAVALDPANVDARIQYARALARLGKGDSANAQMRSALTLDPASADIAGEYAHLLIRARMLDSAAHWINRERDLDPTSPFVAVDLGFLRMAQGRWADALQEYARERTFVATTEAHRAVCEAHLGRPADARRRLAALEALRNKRYVAADRVARVYVALGDADGAFRWLDRAFEERAAALADLTGFLWDPIRSDPRFSVLLARIARSRS